MIVLNLHKPFLLVFKLFFVLQGLELALLAGLDQLLLTSVLKRCDDDEDDADDEDDEAHGSEANDSNRRRCGLTLRYCTTDVRAHLGWNGKGVLVSGNDPEGYWANPPRPAVD